MFKGEVASSLQDVCTSKHNFYCPLYAEFYYWAWGCIHPLQIFHHVETCATLHFLFILFEPITFTKMAYMFLNYLGIQMNISPHSVAITAWCWQTHLSVFSTPSVFYHYSFTITLFCPLLKDFLLNTWILLFAYRQKLTQ